MKAISISVASIIKRPRVFVGVSFDEIDKDVKEWFESVLRACGFEVVTAEPSEHLELGEKIRRKINSCEVSCFVLTRRDKLEKAEEWLPPAWIQGEIGMAYGFGQKIAVFVEEKVVVKGIVPSIEDYTPFSRSRLDQDTHLILASMLFLRLPPLQDAVEILLNQNRLAPIVVLRALRNIVERIADLRRMKVSIPSCSVVYLIQDRRPILVLGAGSTDGVLKDSTWLVVQSRALDKGVIEAPIGVVGVFHVQPNIAQAAFVDWSGETKLRESLSDYSADGTSKKLEGWIARAQDPNLLSESNTADIDNFVKVIDQLLSLVQRQAD